MSRELIQQAKEVAEAYYRDGQYFCSEAIFTVVNDLLGQPLPREAVRLASGFPVGMGLAGCSCGALTGGVMALGLKYGRTVPGGEMPVMFEASKELHDWFKQRYGSSCCRVLIKDVEFGGVEHKQKCIGITGQVAAKVMEKVLSSSENGVL